MHEQVLRPVSKFLLFAMMIPVVVALVRRARPEANTLVLYFVVLLTLSCLTAFLTAILGDAWDNVRHLYLYNLLLDVTLIGVFYWIFFRLGRLRFTHPPRR